MVIFSLILSRSSIIRGTGLISRAIVNYLGTSQTMTRAIGTKERSPRETEENNYSQKRRFFESGLFFFFFFYNTYPEDWGPLNPLVKI